jgi:hypothetical protein
MISSCKVTSPLAPTERERNRCELKRRSAHKPRSFGAEASGFNALSLNLSCRTQWESSVTGGDSPRCLAGWIAPTWIGLYPRDPYQAGEESPTCVATWPVKRAKAKTPLTHRSSR